MENVHECGNTGRFGKCCCFIFFTLENLVTDGYSMALIGVCMVSLRLVQVFLSTARADNKPRDYVFE